MGVLLGGLGALFYGVGDFLGGEGAKRAPAASVVLWAGAMSFPLIAVVAIVVGGEVTAGDLLIGAAAGASGAIGLVMLFAGLGKGHAAAVAPASAAVGAVIPVVFGVLSGERPAALAWVGVVLALPAVALSAWVADPGEVPLGGARFGVLAGLGFGGYAVIIDLTGASSNLLPLVTARASTMVIVATMALAGLWKVTRFGGMPRTIVAANGALDVAGNVALLAALRSGSLALVGVVVSFYPAITVILARAVNGEQLRARQVTGVMLTLVALSAIALA